MSDVFNNLKLFQKPFGSMWYLLLNGVRCNQIDQIVEKVPSLKRISFVAHSLGGLFVRYAVAMLYTTNDDLPGDMGISEELESRGEEHPVFRRCLGPRIAGLEAVNYITLASPHLGVRGKNQVSYFHRL